MHVLYNDCEKANDRIGYLMHSYCQIKETVDFSHHQKPVETISRVRFSLIHNTFIA